MVEDIIKKAVYMNLSCSSNENQAVFVLDKGIYTTKNAIAKNTDIAIWTIRLFFVIR